MRPLILIYAALLVLLNLGLCFAAEPLKAPAATHLAAPPLLSGTFVQEKYIVGLKKPLRSSGDFLVARDHGVIWRIQKPFAAAVVVTSKGIWSLKKSDTGIAREAIQQGNMGLAMDMIQKVLAGDPNSLAKIFSVVEAGSAAAWTLDLKPLDPVVAKFMLAIHLEGSGYVNLVEYTETNGDRTHIDFSGVTDSAGELGSWQAAAFHD